VALPLLQSYGKRKGDALKGSEVRDIVTDYVKKNELQDPVRKGVVRLDVVLCHVTRSDESEMKWEQLFQLVVAGMTRAHEVRWPDGRCEVRKGAPELIKLDVVQRGSNKKVTVVQNLELFGVDPAEFAGRVQKGVSCSTTVTADPSKSKNKTLDQVTAQGNQVDFIGALLRDRYQIAARYIEGLDKAPKRK